jgi:acyl-CoA synthetase (AMP-forming)/AMP-acid ligase II
MTWVGALVSARVCYDNSEVRPRISGTPGTRQGRSRPRSRVSSVETAHVAGQWGLLVRSASNDAHFDRGPSGHLDSSKRGSKNRRSGRGGGHLARSGHIPIGYLGDADKTAATFVQARGKRWALPGDLAAVDADGVVAVLGRGSLCINTGGEKVFPDEVEVAVKGCADVDDVLVVGVPDERYGERVVAAVQTRPGCRVDGEALRASCRGRLAGYKVPRQVVVTDAITRLPTGKADYRWAKAFALMAPADGT